MTHAQVLSFQGDSFSSQNWHFAPHELATTEDSVRNVLLNLSHTVLIARSGDQIGIAHPDPDLPSDPESVVLAFAPAAGIDTLGDSTFCSTYGTRYALYGGAMANGIASEDMVIALGRAGMLGSFGSAGLGTARVEAALVKIQAALPHGPYAVNLIHSPNESSLEMKLAELYLKRGVTVLEASAYMDITPALAWYRVAGLSEAEDGSVQIHNHLIAKLSRKEVAKRFLEPVSEELLKRLLAEGRITSQQAELARRVPLADDITVEADSGGHTDNRPLVGLIPAIAAQRDEAQLRFGYAHPIRVGAGGGIGTPAAALAAFQMGAAYLVTGSINQACVESGASDHTRALLAQAAMTDITMAPAADMFEMGVRVQVLKRGTMFPMRAQKLYELYSRFESLEEIPEKEREKLETQVFKRPIQQIWQDTERFFNERDPQHVTRAVENPHYKMALVFRWYLGLSSRWANSGEKGREMDYQIWCGPAMGCFNDWTRGTDLAEPANRRVADVNRRILTGAAYLQRVRFLQLQGVIFPPSLQQISPAHLAPVD